jgi:hypothetical protein
VRESRLGVRSAPGASHAVSIGPHVGNPCVHTCIRPCNQVNLMELANLLTGAIEWSNVQAFVQSGETGTAENQDSQSWRHHAAHCRLQSWI